jgi:hypothetical protein
MARPKDNPLIRLSRRIWIRALRTSADEKAAKPLEPEENTWKAFGVQLLMLSSHPQYAELPFQALLGVVDNGNDPRRTIRRIPLHETRGVELEDEGVVERKPSRRDPTADPDEVKNYLEVPVDLVECGKQLCPRSEEWVLAYLWRVAMPQLPRLEELRMVISRLTIRLGMHTPSVDEHRPYLSTEEFSELKELSEAEAESRYRRSLEPFIAAKSPDAMSLLAALVAESFITDEEMMMDIHRDAFKQASERLLADEYFKDVQEDFYNTVTARILSMSWLMPAAYHVSSITSPFITMDRWKEITGRDDWISIWDP